MAKHPLLMTFALGRNTAKVNAENSYAVDLVANALGEMSVEYARRETKLNLTAITKRLKQTVETAYTEAVRYAARNMMGRRSPRAWGEDPDPIEIRADIGAGRGTRELLAEWRPLSIQQIRKQTGDPTAKYGKFFIDTGGLKSELLGMARQMVKKTGSIKVQVRDADTGAWRKPLKSTKIIPVADLKLTLLPNVYPSHLPGLRSGQSDDHNNNMKFERSLGLSEEAITKLRGPMIGRDKGLYHRPLLQPVFTYWTLYRIPAIVQEALNRGLVGRLRSNRSGVADYSGG